VSSWSAESADAVLLGGADETAETNRVFSYMNLGRAFAELEAGAELYCLHKNPWWQTSRGRSSTPGAFVVGLEYATGAQATVLGKPSASYFEAALEVLDADPEIAWMVGDDVDADIGGAGALGCTRSSSAPASSATTRAPGARQPEAGPRFDRRRARVPRIRLVTVGIDLTEASLAMPFWRPWWLCRRGRFNRSSPRIGL
jgi:hypothetical protein